MKYVVYGREGREVGVPESIGQPVGRLCSVKCTVLCKALSMVYSVQCTALSMFYSTVCIRVYIILYSKVVSNNVLDEEGKCSSVIWPA